MEASVGKTREEDAGIDWACEVSCWCLELSHRNSEGNCRMFWKL